MKFLQLIFFFILGYSVSEAKIYIARPADPSSSIKSILSQVTDGDTVFVTAGKYFEYDLVINKKIKLFGEGNPVIDAGNKGKDLILVLSDQVTISGLTLKNVARSYVSDNAAIKISNSKDCKIEGNNVINGFFGIYLANSSNCTVNNNKVITKRDRESASGNGIHLWKCRNMTISNNRVEAHRDGIYFEFVSNSDIISNVSTKNVRYGLHFMFSDSCRYIRNLFLKNGAGVAVMYTRGVEMRSNRFESNWGSSSYGLLLKDIRNSSIIDNMFIKNTVGIYSEGSSYLSVRGNEFITNGWALKILANCNDNVFTDNDFISNTFDLLSNSNQSNNKFNGNYWSKYRGYDMNNDRYGDIPYRPVSLFSVLVQKVEPSIMLMHSFFVELLETTEKVFPSLIPKTILDEKPSMRKLN